MITRNGESRRDEIAGLLERAVAPESHPALARVLPHLADDEFAARFDFGLDLILDAAARG